ncbi:YjfK family protein [Pseudomonas sp. 6D_7.1_Bac1]|uniref:YjfK family protein n=1 Tax=Pseudomonas sp. 6D_7.1_Bac1 TaxID=2971615 RepID=UPI0021C97428|nr:YjfK family protein [Pseudomonas sp. 6D_7.1_Bac1]MCU1751102.1 YjfK family protein [Pseudomonas sp. 6D_7.1_Bac1]
MGWFKQLMGLEAPPPKETAPVAGPLGLGQGKALMFDATLKLLLDEKTSVVIPGTQQIWSVGTVDLGQSTWLSRYYMDDEDYWLQVHTTGAIDGQVESVILFNYQSYITLNSEAELRRLAGPNSLIGLPTYTQDGVEYAREWGTEAGQTELVAFSEQVSNPDQSYVVEHRSMLYARETGLTDRREFLLFSVEEDAEGSISLSTSLGISLYSTDLNTI